VVICAKNTYQPDMCNKEMRYGNKAPNKYNNKYSKAVIIKDVYVTEYRYPNII